ncbi:MAG: LCP family protein, partial [Anaerovoracaceae bacterium]
MRSDKDGYYSEEDFEKEFEGQLSDLGEEPKRGTKKKRKGSNAGKKKGKNKKKRNRKKTVIIVLICFILLILAGVAMGYSFLMNKFDKVDQVELEVGDLDIDPKVSEDLKNYRNIAILAIDSRAAYDEDPETARTDGIIIASINKKTKEVKMASVYRDSYLDVEEAGKHVIDKVNHAHAYGGPTNTLRAINRNLDLNVQEFIRMDWMTVANVTDSMGGLEVEVTEATRKELNHIITSSSRALGVYQPADIQEAGKQTLTGTQIVGFCRMRYTDGDDHRAGRMREVINASFDKAK